MKSIKTIIIVFLLIFVLFLLNKTYSSLYSSVDANTDITLGKWNILLNDKNITSVYDDTVNLGDVTWTNINSNSNKVAPGSVGTLQIEVDPTDTDVAVRFDLSYTDKTVDNNKILTVTDVTLGDVSLTKTQTNTYTGIFTLDDIDSDTTKTITFVLEWINVEDNNEIDSSIGLGETEADLIDFHFVASQYNGEEIIPFS